jgi:hypothetical protein
MKSQPFKVGQIYKDVLQDGETLRLPVMLKDAARFCDFCSGSGKIKDASIRCPLCGGSGLLNREGQGVDVDEVVRATSNNTEAARGGAFGTDHALSDAVLADLEFCARVSGHRPGWRVTDEGRAHHTRMNDVYAEVDNEREAAWKDATPPAEMGRIKPPPSDDNRTLDQKVADHRRVMDAEYMNYENQIGNAYRTLK